MDQRISVDTVETVWLAVGFLGQGLFFTRWIVQWFRSERDQQSKIPISFWYFSLFGGLITLAYAIYRRDPVFIAGQSVGTLVYLRNLMLIYRNKNHLGLNDSSGSTLTSRS
jgi:lipid-A-disaccharide synthase-like uncharacterized protein